ncbi:hypothetical protein HK097_003684 [Rhizophlyctis rosea]|uniref:Uncharacterized protein n=1 Tax=Rhizophlyctis rosea TaxID=64517 RepID=A0AAD5WX35_9FUNG|nr:hypothetical protein HK097_003684 [Rhizophlyctis rosea]
MNAKLAFALLSLSALATAAPFDFEKDLLTERLAASNPRVGFVAPRHVDVGRRGYGKKCYSPAPVYGKPQTPGSGENPTEPGTGGENPTQPGKPYVPPKAEKKCKYIPSDPQWPSEEDWEGLRSALTAPEKLIKTVPIGSVCYEGQYFNATRCAEITAQWADSDLQ